MTMAHTSRRNCGEYDRRKASSCPSKTTKTVETLYRNALRSNLELTTLADTKANILVSINGFILTIVITASGFQLSDQNVVYVFSSIILTALISITFAVMTIRPRFKNQLFNQVEEQNEYCSVLYFQDIAHMSPKEYVDKTLQVIGSKERTHHHIIKHLYMLGIEIQQKYIWLRRAYTAFAVGLLITAVIALVALFDLFQ